MQKRDIMLPPLRWVNSVVPEQRWKNRLHAQLLNWRNALPRELMVGSGGVALQVGMWCPRNVARLSRCVASNGNAVLIEPDPRLVHKLQLFLKEKAKHKLLKLIASVIKLFSSYSNLYTCFCNLFTYLKWSNYYFTLARLTWRQVMSALLVFQNTNCVKHLLAFVPVCCVFIHLHQFLHSLKS